MIERWLKRNYLPVGEEKGEGSYGEGDEEVLDEEPAGEGGDSGVHLDDDATDQNAEGDGDTNMDHLLNQRVFVSQLDLSWIGQKVMK